MVYVNYSYYANEYLGTLPEDSFNSLVLKASREIDKNINTRLNQNIIDNLPEKAQDQLQYAACALIDLINKKQISDSQNVNSISIDGVSKNFKSITNDDYRSAKKEIFADLPLELIRYL